MIFYRLYNIVHQRNLIFNLYKIPGTIKSLIQSNSITSLYFCIYFLFNALWRLSPIGINLQGPILCWLQHGEILKQKSWPKNELTKNPNSTFVSDSGFFVSKRSTFLLKNCQPWVRMHRIGPCNFIPAVSHAIIIKWRTVIFYYGSGIWLSELSRNLP